MRPTITAKVLAVLASVSAALMAMARAIDAFRGSVSASERLRTEDQQRPWLERLLDDLPVGVTIFDERQRLIVRNSSMNRIHPHPDPKRLVGATLDELIQEIATTVAHPGPETDREAFVRDLAARYRSAPEGRFETTFPNGAVVDVHFRWVGDEHLVMVHSDISGLRAAERRATDAEQQMRSIVESLPIALSLYDERERLILRNERAIATLPALQVPVALGELQENVLRKSPPDEVLLSDGRTAQGAAAIDLMMSLYRSRPAGVLRARIRQDQHVTVNFRNIPGIGRIVVTTDVTDLVRAQQATQQSERRAVRLEQRMRSIVDSLPIGLVLYDEQERLVLANRWVNAEMPLTAPPVPGQSRQETILREAPPDEATTDDGVTAQGQAAATLMLEAYRGRPEGVIAMRSKDRHYRLQFRNLPGIGRIVASTNVSDLVRAQRDASESERRLSTAIAEIPISFALFAEDGTLQLFNDEFCREFRAIADTIKVGASAHDIVAAYFDSSDRPPPRFGGVEEWRRAKRDTAHRRTYIETLVQTFLHGPAEPMDVERDYGTYRLRRATLPNGEIARVSADITDLREKEAEIRRLGESALAQRTAILQQIIDTIPQAIAVVGPSRQIRFANRSLSDLLDDAHGEGAIPQLSTLFRSIGVRPAIVDGLLNAPGEIEVASRAQRPLRVRTTAVPTGDTLVTISDLTEQRQAEAERLEQQQRVLQAEKSQAVLTLAGTIAHDFNNLLAVVLGFSSIASSGAKKVLEGKSLPAADAHELADVASSIDKVIASAERGRNVVTSLTALTHEREVAIAPLDMRSTVKDTEELLRVLVPSSSRLEVSLHKSPCTVIANATQIEQIVTNLCVNAVHALEGKAGQVSIAVDIVDVGGGRAEGLRVTEVAVHKGGSHIEIADDGTVSMFIGVLAKGPHARLQVLDTGHGMTEEVARKIFTPFFTTKPAGVGTGLGLSSVIEIVAAHRGGIHVRTKAQVGTAFMILFPLADPAELGQDMAADTPISGDLPALTDIRTETRVLVIDDEELLAELGANVLRRAGYEAEAFTDPAAALQRFKSDPRGFDLVVTDQTMPGMTGLELIEKMRTVRGDVPIIICTGHAPEIERRAAASVGFGRILRKPYAPAALATLVRDTLADPWPMAE